MKNLPRGLFGLFLLAGIVTACDTGATDGFTNVERETFPGPDARGGAPAVWVPGRDQVVLFGGMSPITNDTWGFSAETEEWAEITNQDSAPAERCHHTLVAGPSGQNILMFAGFDLGARFNDTWRFNPRQQQWERIDVGGELPGRRCLQTSAYIDSQNKMLIHGGVSGAGAASEEFFADTWIFDVDQTEWSQIESEESPGKVRGAVSFYSSERNAVFVWGGKQVSSYPTTLWQFDVESNAWSTVNTSGDTPRGREDPTVFWNEPEQVLYVTHGFNENAQDPNLESAFELDLSTFEWEQLDGQIVPDGRWRASAAFDANRQIGYMFGGWIGFDETNLADTWTYDFQARDWSPVRSIEN